MVQSPFLRRGFGLVLAVVCSGATLRAAAIELPADVRATIEQGIANGRYQGIAVGLIDRDEHGEWMFGTVAPGGAAPVNADAFEIGSTTRSFTGLLFAKALLAGTLRLDDTLAKRLPDVHFADAKLAATTLEQLATHRSGLPPIPSNLFPRDARDPYVGYDRAALLSYLAHTQVDPGSDYRYSDLGIALLGEIVARAYGKDYRALVASEILAPLALTQSGFGNVPRLLEGFHDGEPALHWQHQVLSPAVGMRATLSDLLRFARMQIQPEANPLRAAILLAREARSGVGARETALAWQIVAVASDGQNWPLLWQAGITDGFASFVGFRTDRQRALVLLGNAGIDLSGIGLTLLAGHDAPPAPPRLLTLDANAQLAYEGLYRFDGGGDLVVRANDGALSAQISGLLPQSIFAYDDDAFELAGQSGQLTFERSESKIRGAILHRDGVNLHAQRLSDGAPVLKRNTIDAKPDELAAYAGDYAFSPALRAHVVATSTALRVQMTATTPIAVRSCASDRFCDEAGTIEIAFARDAKKRITALDWRQGVFESRATRDDW